MRLSYPASRRIGSVLGRAMIAMVALLAVALVACDAERDVNIARGRGLRVATLSANDKAAVWSAALASAFDTTDPSLTLLLDPRALPREAGMAAGTRHPASVVKAARDRGAVLGTCEPPLDDVRHTPHCTARGPGYVARFSDVLRRGGDTVEVYLAVTKFDTERSGASENLRFERAYEVVGRAGAWRAVAEARVPVATSTTPATR